jgi:hypothetical protein
VESKAFPTFSRLERAQGNTPRKEKLTPQIISWHMIGPQCNRNFDRQGSAVSAGSASSSDEKPPPELHSLSDESPSSAGALPISSALA